jgi:hypothetical protein
MALIRVHGKEGDILVRVASIDGFKDATGIKQKNITVIHSMDQLKDEPELVKDLLFL